MNCGNVNAKDEGVACGVFARDNEAVTDEEEEAAAAAAAAAAMAAAAAEAGINDFDEVCVSSRKQVVGVKRRKSHGCSSSDEADGGGRCCSKCRRVSV